MAKKVNGGDPTKRKARKVKKAARYVKKAKKMEPKLISNQLSSSRKKQVKGMAQAATSENLERKGKAIVKSGGQGKLVKKSTLKVTPKSIKKRDEAVNARLNKTTKTKATKPSATKKAALKQQEKNRKAGAKRARKLQR